jgi:nitrogen-specific signal transduction histidine kinase
MKAMTAYGQKIGWNSAIVTLQSTQGLLLHAKKLNLQPDAIEATLLDGRVTKIPYSMVSWVYPAMMLKGAERLDTRQRYKQNNPEGQTSGRHLIFSLNPPFAMITDDAVYNSQLMRLLVLDRADKEYFELISSNPRGKVYKIKK